MHRKIAVAEIEIDDDAATILKLGTVHASGHFPVGTLYDNTPDRSLLNSWWRGRAIPASRQNFKEAMENLGVSSSERLLTKCFGLSLSDQYWVNPVENLADGIRSLEWEKINFFDNPFSEDVGNALFGKKYSKDLNLASPDNTSDGWLKKKWKIIDGKRCLIKGGSPPAWQEPFNEVFAAAVMRRLNINHVPYSVIWEENLPYSLCECFITSETELVSAEYIFSTQRVNNGTSMYQHFLNCCSDLGINKVRENIDKMLTLDYIIANEDRHRYNFGAVRNAETLEWLGIAPVYDSGSSLWHRSLTENIADSKNEQSKTFCPTHDEQIKLVKDFSWLNLTDLTGIDEEFSEILRTSPFINDERRDALCLALRKRTEMLAEIIMPQEKMFSLGGISAEIDENEQEM